VCGRAVAVVVLCLTLGCARGSAQVAAETCFGAAATIIGTEDDDQVIGTPGPDVIVTLGGDDTVVSLEGDDRICLGPGNDIVLPGDGDDSVDGGPGLSDVVTYDDASGAVRIDLQAGLVTGGSGHDTVAGFESAGGSKFDDTILGDENINVLFGQGGNDTLDGRAHSDALVGGPGDDQLIGHPDDGDAAAYVPAPAPVNVDLQTGIATGEGRDTLTSIESLLGTPYADTLAGNEGLNFIMGFGGNDQLDGRGGFDIAAFLSPVTASLVTNQARGEGTDKLTNFEGLAGSQGNDHLTGDTKQNFLEGYAGNDTLAGGGGADIMFGDGGDDRIDGGAGDDKLFGGPDNDVLNGGAGRSDTVSYINAPSGVHADLGAKSASGGDGLDRLNGVEGLSGSSFDDTLVGDGKANELFGNEGDDTLSGGAGPDFLGGGQGSDTAHAAPGTDYCLDTEVTRGCEITGAPSIPGSPAPPPVPPRVLAQSASASASAPVGRSQRVENGGNLLTWMARTVEKLTTAFSSLARARTAKDIVAPRIADPPAVRATPSIADTADYEYSAEPVCISRKNGGTTEIAPPNVVHPVGNDDRPEEAWWQGTLYRQTARGGPFRHLQARTGWARAQLAGNVVLPGGIIVWKDFSGRRAFRSPVPFKVPRGRYVWKGQIYWVRSGGRIFAPVEPHIIRTRTIRHDKNCNFH
jgi:Ca2+-binding RTX toxin-like protein